MRFLRRLWRWLVARVRGNTKKQKKPEIKTEQIVNKSIRSDAEYEQIFMKLLDRVAEGITPGGIKGFLFGNNISETELVGWLQGFGTRVLASSA